MMQTLLSVVISVWFGWACGAITDEVVPGFWFVWGVIGVALAFLTSIYVVNRRHI
jgi:hypothetical protein